MLVANLFRNLSWIILQWESNFVICNNQIYWLKFDEQTNVCKVIACVYIVIMLWAIFSSELCLSNENSEQKLLLLLNHGSLYFVQSNTFNWFCNYERLQNMENPPLSSFEVFIWDDRLIPRFFNKNALLLMLIYQS